MINGVHTLIYTPDADRLRAFFRDVLGFPSVDAGHGWLIFGLPPGELAAHPAGEHENPAAGARDTRFEMYLMCDDVEATATELKAKGVELSQPISDQGWGRVTAITLPGGGELGLYEPRHPTALGLSR